MKQNITVIGSMNYDVILKISRLPYKGETMPANGANFSAGGKGANQAVQAAKLGTNTYMVGCVGNDAPGTFLINQAKEYSVNTDYVRISDNTSGMGIVNALDDGSVHACIVRGANYDITKEDIDKAVPALEKSGICILQMEIPIEINEYAIDKAKEAGCKVLLNAAPAEKISEEYLKKVDILVVNEVEASFYAETEIDTVEKAQEEIVKMSEKYGNDIIITLGSLGAVVSEDKKVYFIPAKKVEAVETTGAGDSYIGATGYALTNGYTLKEACVFATGCSAITVCRCGAQPSMPTLKDLEG